MIKPGDRVVLAKLPPWAHGSYGRKIEAAVVSRRMLGAPAIISEEHWRRHLDEHVRG